GAIADRAALARWRHVATRRLYLDHRVGAWLQRHWRIRTGLRHPVASAAFLGGQPDDGVADPLHRRYVTQPASSAIAPAASTNHRGCFWFSDCCGTEMLPQVPLPPAIWSGIVRRHAHSMAARDAGMGLRRRSLVFRATRERAVCRAARAGDRPAAA